MVIILALLSSLRPSPQAYILTTLGDVSISTRHPVEHDERNQLKKFVPYLTMTSRAKTLLQQPPKIRESIKGNSGAIMLANEVSMFAGVSIVMVSVKEHAKSQQLLLI